MDGRGAAAKGIGVVPLGAPLRPTCRSCNGSKNALFNAQGYHDSASLQRGTKLFVKSNPTELEICNWCVAYLAKSFNTPAERIDPSARFARLGMDSAASVFFVVELEEWLGIELPTEIVFTYPTPARLSQHIAQHYLTEDVTRGRIG